VVITTVTSGLAIGESLEVEMLSSSKTQTERQLSSESVPRGMNTASLSVRESRGRPKMPLVVVTFLCLVGMTCSPACNRPGKLTFALPAADWWTASPFLIDESGSFFRSQGLQLATVEVNSGLASKNAVVAGTADVGLAAATPLALAAAKGEKIVILATYLRSSSIVGLLRPRESTANSLPPEPVAVVPSTISESYLYQYLTRIGQQDLMAQKKLQQLQQRPADIPGSLRSGSAKSAVIWEPFLSLSAEQGGYVVDRSVSDFQVSLYLITRPEVYNRHRVEIDAFLKGVEDSCRFLRENSDVARRQMERHFNFRSDFLAPTWSGVQYGLSFNRASMTAELTREALTAKALGSIPEIPNFDYLFSPTLPK
jgi:ABC-type nitrate/sulfonate/bicarbonate transport system substrate-binding protein